MFINFAHPFELPAYWLNHPEVIKSIDSDTQLSASAAIGVPHACPLSLKWDHEREWWQLPIEPVVTINGKNTIIKRNVLKTSSADIERRGSVKELWSQDDYEINISGVFIATDGRLPENDLRRLRNYCEGRQSIMVDSPLFTVFNIRRIAIEDFQFPFTKGIENQMFSLKATSDDFDEKELLAPAN